MILRALPGLLAMFVLLDAAAASASPVPPDHDCMGRWVGRGRNTGSPSYWTIDLTMTASPSGGRCGTIEYTNPACGGTLETCRLVGADIHTQEHYTHNDGDCAPAGRVIIRCEGDRMRYSWIGWERVDSVLHRPGAIPGSQPGTQPSNQPGTNQPQNPAPPSPTPAPTNVPPIPAPPPAVPGQTPPPAIPTPTPRVPIPEDRGGGFFSCSVRSGAHGPWMWFSLSAFLLLSRRRRRQH